MDPEDPNLYQVGLADCSVGKILHEMTQRFGFRTIDVFVSATGFM
jgi:beta-galactosidase/beta-glucuronidase